MGNRFNKIFIKKDYLIKHDILKALLANQAELTKDLDYDIPVYPMDVSMSDEDLASVTGYKINEIAEQIDYLFYKQLIEKHFNPPDMYYSITTNGKLILNQKNYLKEGKKSSWALSKEVATFITTLGLFLIAVGSFISNMNTTKENEKGIKEMQGKMDSILLLYKQSELGLKSTNLLNLKTP